MEVNFCESKSVNSVIFNCIEHGLFLGKMDLLPQIKWNLTAATNVEFLIKNEITHIITANVFPLSSEIIMHLRDMKTMFIKITDQSFEDMCTYFDKAHDFIKKGQAFGNVFVHCFYGISRSVTIVAAYLMKEYQWPTYKALQFVKEKHIIAAPNEGFVQQLFMYENMGWRVDLENIQYRIYRMEVVSEQMFKMKTVLQSCLMDYEVIKPDPLVLFDNTTVTADRNFYRCKNCRRILARFCDIIPHCKMERVSWKNSRWLGLGSADNNPQSHDLCSKILFIQPLKWIYGVECRESGKIMCPKCRCKLGAFNWLTGKSELYILFLCIPPDIFWKWCNNNQLMFPYKIILRLILRMWWEDDTFFLFGPVQGGLLLPVKPILPME